LIRGVEVVRRAQLRVVRVARQQRGHDELGRAGLGLRKVDRWQTGSARTSRPRVQQDSLRIQRSSAAVSSKLCGANCVPSSSTSPSSSGTRAKSPACSTALGSSAKKPPFSGPPSRPAVHGYEPRMYDSGCSARSDSAMEMCRSSVHGSARRHATAASGELLGHLAALRMRSNCGSLKRCGGQAVKALVSASPGGRQRATLTDTAGVAGLQDGGREGRVGRVRGVPPSRSLTQDLRARAERAGALTPERDPRRVT
jgi:hypothetical protein